MTPTKEQIEKEAFIAAEELWDKHSEHIDDDIHSLERVAGTVIMFKHDFIKAVQEYASQSKQSGGWVKASERLPKEGLVHFKMEGGLNDVVFYSKKYGFYKPKPIRQKDGLKTTLSTEIVPLKYKLEEIFWLDESLLAPSINETLLEALKRVRETIIKAGDVFTWASELKIIDNALAGEVSDNKPLEALRKIANINGSQSDLEMLTEAISIASNALSEYGKNS